MTVLTVALLLGWGTLVGLDLVSLPQMMIARPLVAGALAGALAGDVATGLQLGVLFELFQFDILPVGAVRYPEYGPAVVVAVAAAQGAPPAVALGTGVVVGLVVAMIGGLSIHAMRRQTARAVRRAAPGLEAGDVRVLLRVHTASLLRDLVRGALVTGVGLGFAALARAGLGFALSARGVTLLALVGGGIAIATAAAGTLRLVGRGPNLAWFAVGLGGGAAVAWLW